MQLCVRVGTAFMGMSVPLLALTRGIITTSVALLVICASRLPALAREDWLLVLGRGAIGASAMVCKYEAAARLPLSEATTVIFTSPAVTLLLSHVFLGEAVRGVEVASCVCCLAGVLVISLSPGSAESLPAGHPVVHRPSGILFAVLCALLQATAYVVTRWMGSRVHSQWNVLSLGFASLLLGLGLLNRSLPAEAQRALSSRSHLLIIAGAGIGSYLGASGVNRALQLLSAGTISVLRSADIPISLALGFAFLGERLSSWYSLAGTVSITLASLTLGHSRATRA